MLVYSLACLHTRRTTDDGARSVQRRSSLREELAPPLVTPIAQDALQLGCDHTAGRDTLEFRYAQVAMPNTIKL